MEPIFSPADRSATAASAGLRLITFGTTTEAGPLETSNFTGASAATSVPDFGLVPTTSPFGVLSANTSTTVTSSFGGRVARASSGDSPFTFGRITVGGPLDTTRVITAPGGCAPRGVQEITFPSGTVSLGSIRLGLLSARFDARSTAVAWSSVSPSSDGTVTGSGPLERVSVTVAPFYSRSGDCGSWETTRPTGNFSS